MDNCIKKHVDELYATGKTTFRDVNGEYPDYVVEFDALARNFVDKHIKLLSSFMMIQRDATICHSGFKDYAKSEIKQLCIDYYGDE